MKQTLHKFDIPINPLHKFDIPIWNNFQPKYSIICLTKVIPSAFL